MSKIIVTDMDDVLVSLLDAWIDYFNTKYNKSVKYEDITDWDMLKFYPDLTEKELHESLNTEELWKAVKPIKESVIYLKKLYDEGYKILVCTACYFTNIAVKLINCLFPNYPFLTYKDIIICYDKSLIKCDYIIDDYHENIKNSKATRFLMNAPYNRNISNDYYDFRVNSFEDVYYIIKELEKK